MFRRPCKLLVLILCCIVTITSCYPTLSESKKAQVSQVVLVSSNDPATFNFAMNDSPYSVFRFIYQGLLSENGVTGKLEPALAESWSITNDSKRIILTLKDGLKWSDGVPLTVDDVVFTFQDIYLNKKIPTVFRDFLRIGGNKNFPTVRKISARQVEFTLPQPFKPFLRYLVKLAILPAHALRTSVQLTDNKGQLKFLSMWGTDTQPTKIIVNGPYKIESYLTGERVILRRNPYYWRTDEQGKSLPYIERINWQIISSSDNELVRYRSGELDCISVAPENFSLLKKAEKRGKYTVYHANNSSQVSFVGFNLSQATNTKGIPFVDKVKSRWFNNLAFRQAVAYAIDRERMRVNIYQGLGEVQHSPIGVESPYYLSASAGLKVYDYNPLLAKKILLEAGFKYNKQNQLIDWDGNLVEFNMLVKSEDKSRIDAAVQIQQGLKDIGIISNLQVLSFNTILQRLLGSRDWDCYVGAFGVPGADLEPNLMSLFWSSSGSFHQFNLGARPGKNHIQGWKVSDWEKKIDNLLVTASKEQDESKRKKIYGEFQQVVTEHLPVFFLVNPLSFYAVRDRIKNVKYTSLGGLLWNIDEWKIKNRTY
jgi:peptide/nickel transport system substrate-binding protein